MLCIVVMEMLREMREENKNLRDDLKNSEKIEEENSVKKTKTRKLCVPPEVKVRATICFLQAIYVWKSLCCMYWNVELCAQGVQVVWH